MNSTFSFNKYNFFSFLAAGFYLKDVAFARKIMLLPESGVLRQQCTQARTPMALRGSMRLE